MVDIDSPDASPSLEEVQQKYNLADDEVDAGFGVQQLEPDINPQKYTINVAPTALPKVLPASAADALEDAPTGRVSGDVRIEPFGPPQ